MRSLPVLALVLTTASSCAAPSATLERTIDIVATDYAFDAPDTVVPGPAILRLTNHGSVPHEVIVMKLRAGTSLAEVFAARQRGEDFRPSLEGGNAVIFAGPGSTGDGRLTVDFEPGRDYVLWCDFQDSDEAPKHSAMGMFKQIHVGGSADTVFVNMPARSVIIDVGDYVFRVADTLPVGVADFTMTNSGLQRHEVSFGRLRSGTTSASFFDAYLQGNNVDSLYDDDGTILTAYGGDRNDFAVRIDLVAGRSYVLLCEFRDTPEAPRHTQMGMFKGIEVR